MGDEILTGIDLSTYELSPELEVEDDELAVLRCSECGLAWTAELFEEAEGDQLSCPRCADDNRSSPLVPMGGVERRPLVRGGTVRRTYYYNPETSEHIGIEEKVIAEPTVRRERSRHALRKAILRTLGVTITGR